MALELGKCSCGGGATLKCQACNNYIYCSKRCKEKKRREHIKICKKARPYFSILSRGSNGETKTQIVRSVKIPPQIEEMLEKSRKIQDLMDLSSKITADPSGSTLNLKEFKNAVEKSGLKIDIPSHMILKSAMRDVYKNLSSNAGDFGNFITGIKKDKRGEGGIMRHFMIYADQFTEVPLSEDYVTFIIIGAIGSLHFIASAHSDGVEIQNKGTYRIGMDNLWSGKYEQDFMVQSTDKLPCIYSVIDLNTGEMLGVRSLSIHPEEEYHKSLCQHGKKRIVSCLCLRRLYCSRECASGDISHRSDCLRIYEKVNPEMMH